MFNTVDRGPDWKFWAIWLSSIGLAAWGFISILSN